MPTALPRVLVQGKGVPCLKEGVKNDWMWEWLETEEKMEFVLVIISGRLTRKDKHFVVFASRKLTMHYMILWPIIRDRNLLAFAGILAF